MGDEGHEAELREVSLDSSQPIVPEPQPQHSSASSFPVKEAIPFTDRLKFFLMKLTENKIYGNMIAIFSIVSIPICILLAILLKDFNWIIVFLVIQLVSLILLAPDVVIDCWHFYSLIGKRQLGLAFVSILLSSGFVLLLEFASLPKWLTWTWLGAIRSASSDSSDEGDVCHLRDDSEEDEDTNIIFIGFGSTLILGLLFVVLLYSILPIFSFIEEVIFRRGTASWRNACLRSCCFGLAHLSSGVSLGLSAFVMPLLGLYFSREYFVGVTTELLASDGSSQECRRPSSVIPPSTTPPQPSSETVDHSGTSPSANTHPSPSNTHPPPSNTHLRSSNTHPPPSPRPPPRLLLAYWATPLFDDDHKDWEECSSRSGRTFFYNSRTEKAQQQMPLSLRCREAGVHSSTPLHLTHNTTLVTIVVIFYVISFAISTFDPNSSSTNLHPTSPSFNLTLLSNNTLQIYFSSSVANGSFASPLSISDLLISVSPEASRWVNASDPTALCYNSTRLGTDSSLFYRGPAWRVHLVALELQGPIPNGTAVTVDVAKEAVFRYCSKIMVQSMPQTVYLHPDPVSPSTGDWRWCKPTSSDSASSGSGSDGSSGGWT